MGEIESIETRFSNWNHTNAKVEKPMWIISVFYKAVFIRFMFL